MSSTTDYVKSLLAESGCVSLEGHCQKCGADVSVILFRDGDVEGTGGMVKGEGADPEFKCSACLEKDGGMISPTRCEVYSRVVGYLRPVKQWNKGKQEEWGMRKTYSMKGVACQ